MTTVYPRGKILWCKVKERGAWVPMSTGFRVGDEAKARRFALRAQREIDAAAGVMAPVGPLTVALYAEQWLRTRREMHDATRRRYEETGAGRVQFRDHATDDGRMRKHVLPHLGSLVLADVRPRHLATWIHALRTTTTLAPHTIRNVYGLAGAMFRDAAIAGHLDATPAILTAAQLGEDVGSAAGAGRYTRDQLALMIGATVLPEHARVFAALGGLAGLRLGAIAGLQWGDLDTGAAPLWRLTSSRTYAGRPTKTGRSSAVPVHPVLADMLTRWRLGWGALIGRAPTAADPIVPRAPGRWRDAPGTPHTKKTGGDLMDSILAALEIPPAPMKAHALRSTFVSLAIEDGADDRLIERITHTTGQGRRAFERYDRADYWPMLCAEVAKIRIVPKPGGSVVDLGTVLGTARAATGDQT